MLLKMSRLAEKLERAVKNATDEAGRICKGVVVDDIDYWGWFDRYDVWRAQNQAGQYVQQDGHEGEDLRDEHEAGLGVAGRLRRLAFPRTFRAARIDSRGYRNLQLVKRFVKDNGTNDDYNRWNKCNNFFVKRHELFVAALDGDAKEMYENLPGEERAEYGQLQGYQKTNFVLRVVAARLLIHVEEDKRKAIAKFYTAEQRSNQSANDFITFVEKQRHGLVRLGVTLPDTTVRTVLMSGLTPIYKSAVIHYRYDEHPLEEVKKTLRAYKFRDLVRNSPDQRMNDGNKRSRGSSDAWRPSSKRYKGNRHHRPSLNEGVTAEQYRRIANDIRSQYQNFQHGRNQGSFSRNTRNTPPSRNFSRNSPRRNTGNDSRRNRVECFKCHKLGHYANECREGSDTRGTGSSAAAVGAMARAGLDSPNSEASDDFWNSLIEDANGEGKTD